MPLLFYVIPLWAGKGLKLYINLKDGAAGLAVSALILSPLLLLLLLRGGGIHLPDSKLVIYQLLGVALPEELYFRGFLQEGMGNNLRAVVIVSLLFSIMHLPQLIFYGQFLAPLTFFPSLIMGYLYMRTGNVLASTIFHFFANMVFYGSYRT
ncbi:MAG: type II CAAX prenyl endopeptidase Rce1 family protein [Thermodesulfovibrionales bacterium]